MSDNQVLKLEVSLARVEERQIMLYKMVETSLSNYADVVNRVSALEHLRSKVFAIAGVAGLLCSVAWDMIKNRMNN
jgi:hypothetical protein